MQTVLVTGANKGIGFETAKLMLTKGHYVYLGCRNEALGKEAVSRLKTEGLSQCELMIIDTADSASVQQAATLFGSRNTTLDILINNAAILGRRPTVDNPLTLDDVKPVFETNFFGTIRVTEAFMPFLKQSAHPRIVNVTSTLASLTLHQDPAWPLYNAKLISYGPSKTAINAYTVALAYEYRNTNFRINCVTPGYTSTDLNGHSGGKPAEVNCQIIVRYAILDDDGPTGQYFGESGAMPW
jgi:NAD(P)-dependent dehydrogenase (short-subunit alcohol dehydrogenase family)